MVSRGKKVLRIRFLGSRKSGGQPLPSKIGKSDIYRLKQEMDYLWQINGKYHTWYAKKSNAFFVLDLKIYYLGSFKVIKGSEKVKSWI